MMFFMLIIAVLMILAIMMGTVHERMREISIFSSVGLSPRHVAGMFLIESLVYAGLASVLGYFIGIAALWFMTRWPPAAAGLLPELPGRVRALRHRHGDAGDGRQQPLPDPRGRAAGQPLAGAVLEDRDATPRATRWRIRLPFIATSLRRGPRA